MAETFGETSKLGLSTRYGNGKVELCRFQSGSAGTLASISPYINTLGVATTFRCAIYDADLNLLENGTTEEKVGAADWDGFIPFEFSTPPTIEAATYYFLCCQANLTGWDDLFYAHGGSAGQYKKKQLTWGDGWPAVLVPPWTSDEADIYSIYATYEEAPPPAVKAIVQATLIAIPPLVVLPTLSQIIKVTGG